MVFGAIRQHGVLSCGIFHCSPCGPRGVTIITTGSSSHYFRIYVSLACVFYSFPTIQNRKGDQYLIMIGLYKVGITGTLAQELSEVSTVCVRIARLHCFAVQLRLLDVCWRREPPGEPR